MNKPKLVEVYEMFVWDEAIQHYVWLGDYKTKRQFLRVRTAFLTKYRNSNIEMGNDKSWKKYVKFLRTLKNGRSYIRKTHPND